MDFLQKLDECVAKLGPLIPAFDGKSETPISMEFKKITYSKKLGIKGKRKRSPTSSKHAEQEARKVREGLGLGKPPLSKIAEALAQPSQEGSEGDELSSSEEVVVPPKKSMKTGQGVRVKIGPREKSPVKVRDILSGSEASSEEVEKVAEPRKLKSVIVADHKGKSGVVDPVIGSGGEGSPQDNIERSPAPELVFNAADILSRDSKNPFTGEELDLFLGIPQIGPSPSRREGGETAVASPDWNAIESPHVRDKGKAPASPSEERGKTADPSTGQAGGETQREGETADPPTEHAEGETQRELLSPSIDMQAPGGAGKITEVTPNLGAGSSRGTRTLDPQLVRPYPVYREVLTSPALAFGSEWRDARAERLSSRDEVRAFLPGRDAVMGNARTPRDERLYASSLFKGLQSSAEASSLRGVSLKDGFDEMAYHAYKLGCLSAHLHEKSLRSKDIWGLRFADACVRNSELLNLVQQQCPEESQPDKSLLYQQLTTSLNRLNPDERTHLEVMVRGLAREYFPGESSRPAAGDNMGSMEEILSHMHATFRSQQSRIAHLEGMIHAREGLVQQKSQELSSADLALSVSAEKAKVSAERTHHLTSENAALAAKCAELEKALQDQRSEFEGRLEGQRIEFETRCQDQHRDFLEKSAAFDEKVIMLHAENVELKKEVERLRKVEKELEAVSAAKAELEGSWKEALEEIHLLEAKVATFATMGSLLETERVAKTEAERAIGVLTSEVKRLEGLIQSLELENNQLVPRFMGSDAFVAAAAIKLRHFLRKSMLSTCEALRQYYPFTLEEFGLIPTKEFFQELSLAGYSWDAKKDRLIAPDGAEADTKVNIKRPVTKPKYSWANTRASWPKELPRPH